MDRDFLFNTIKNEVELLLKKEGLSGGIVFSPKINTHPDSPFNMIIEQEAPILNFIDEYSDSIIKENLEHIFEKYEHFSEMIDNTLHILPF